MERFGETTYELQGLKGEKSQIVHFNRLKACLPNFRLPDNTPTKSKPMEVTPPQQRKIGSRCQLIDEEGDTPAATPTVYLSAGRRDQPPVAARRYPDRERRVPGRHGTYIQF